MITLDEKMLVRCGDEEIYLGQLFRAAFDAYAKRTQQSGEHIGDVRFRFQNAAGHELRIALCDFRWCCCADWDF